MRDQTFRERLADGTIHFIGIALGLAAFAVLASLAPDMSGLTRPLSLMIYATCLVAMLVFSALYNVLAKNNRESFFRRLDHAAIFLMIGGTYTPFATSVIGGATGRVVLTVVWIGAATGAFLKLVEIRRLDKLTVPLCLALGWVIIFAYKPLINHTSPLGLGLLLAGGLLYSLGTMFYSWKNLPFQNAIWHAFVLAAAICHFGAVMREVALPAVLGA